MPINSCADLRLSFVTVSSCSITEISVVSIMTFSVVRETIGLGLTLALLLIFTYIGIRELIFELRMKKVMRFLDTPEGKQKLEDLSDAVSRETGLPKWALFCGADEFGNIIVSPRSPDAHIEQYEMEDENNGRL